MTDIFNKKELKERRRLLRNQATEPEKLLWERLRKKQINGVRFRRQVSIGGYVVDFYSPKNRLAIEIDGQSHNRDSAREYDTIREETITQLGIQFIRFTNDDVLNDMEYVLRKIEDAAKTFPLTKGEIQRGSELDKGK